jgi:hypothetical protein
MDISQTKRTIKAYATPSSTGVLLRKSILIEGDHGKGKSQVVKQVCSELSTELKKPYQLVDIRLAQREVGDIIGMPRSADKITVTVVEFVDGKLTKAPKTFENVTIHDAPLWFPQDETSFGIIFLDEFHYATKDVQQSIMELALDYRLNMRPVPQGWTVVSAGNHNQDIYGGTTINPALYDRFLKIEFKPTVPEWLSYADQPNATVYGPVHRAIRSYINKFTADLDAPETIEPGKIYPSRRSWCSLSEVCAHMEDLGSDPFKDLNYLTLLAKGYIGETVGLNFVEYVRKEYKVYTAEDVLNKWSEEMAKEFAELQPVEVAFYSNEITVYVKKHNKNLSKKQSENLFEFVKVVSKESASGFWLHFAKEARQIALTWYNHPGVKEYLYGILNKSSSVGA